MAYVSGSNWKIALGVWGRVVVGTIMCAILYLSLSMLGAGLLAKEVGYYLLEQDENSSTVIVDTHYYAEGETSADVKLEEGQRLSQIKEMSPATEASLNIVSEILMLVLLAIFPYSVLWDLGSRDDNGVQFGYREKDVWRGLKIGTMATIPSALLYVLLVLSRCGVISPLYFPFYRLLNVPFLPYINGIVGSQVRETTAISLGGMLGIFVTLLVIPAVAGIGYYLGYRQFSIHEILVYQKKKSN